MKRCCDCKQLKPLEDFWLHKKDGTKRQGCCKTCGNNRMTLYRKQNKTKIREYHQGRWKVRNLPEKISVFRRSNPDTKDPNLTPENVRKKFGINPHCYLTGRPIDLSAWETYSLDHIIPVSKGGESSLANCGLTARQVNYSKSILSPQEFISLCREVIDWNQKDSTLDNLNV